MEKDKGHGAIPPTLNYEEKSQKSEIKDNIFRKILKIVFSTSDIPELSFFLRILTINSEF